MSRMSVKVQKKNPAGVVTYEYEGVMLSRDHHSIVLEALFDRADMPFMDVVFKTGDRFVESYFTDRWYNIFAIHDREDGKVKGWYCNVGKPAVIEDGVVSYVDHEYNKFYLTTLNSFHYLITVEPATKHYDTAATQQYDCYNSNNKCGVVLLGFFRSG